jgi:hypothetical protein
VTVLLLALDPVSFILGFLLGYLYYRWDVPLYLFNIVDAHLYPLAVFLGITPTYELVVQVYVYPLVGSGQGVILVPFQTLRIPLVGQLGIVVPRGRLRKLSSRMQPACLGHTRRR